MVMSPSFRRLVAPNHFPPGICTISFSRRFFFGRSIREGGNSLCNGGNAQQENNSWNADRHYQSLSSTYKQAAQHWGQTKMRSEKPENPTRSCFVLTSEFFHLRRMRIGAPSIPDTFSPCNPRLQLLWDRAKVSFGMGKYICPWKNTSTEKAVS